MVLAISTVLARPGPDRTGLLVALAAGRPGVAAALIKHHQTTKPPYVSSAEALVSSEEALAVSQFGHQFHG